ncbi:MAG TPA: RNA methyltransferase [Chryseolinea sp.]|nr:RNA methyltransferase [Chryseolinea sp.]HPH45424.1 RNA methyltransferase [Chryseolinea sp.]HPM28753.1 RNA methyltransferase [Chryseolinea sp.]
MQKLKLQELGRISVDEFKEADKISVCIMLDNVRSLHNVGSTFRTADAFRIEKIYLTGITGQPPHREIQKTALGATESVEWQYAEHTKDALHALKVKGYTIVVVEQTTKSKPLHEFILKENEKYCLVFGNEVDGVSEEALAEADVAIEIPQLGTKHSLNVSVCVGIVAWEVFKKVNF